MNIFVPIRVGERLVVGVKEDTTNLDEVFCKRCHRKLKDEKSKEIGFGKICYEKYIKKSAMFLFEMEVNNEEN